MLEWGKLNNPLIVPQWLKRIDGKVHVIELDKANLGGMKLMLIDDSEASVASVAISSPVGYFNENDANYPGGTNFMMATRVLLEQMAKNSSSVGRNGEVEPETSFWSLQIEETKLLDGFSSLWSSFSNLGHQPIKNNLSQLIDFE